MLVSTEILLNQFLRTFPNEFSAKDLSRMLGSSGIKTSVSECIECLESNPYVFTLEKNKYITRAGAFTDRIFSFKPTQFELDNHVFVAGDRCMPFIDSEMLTSSLQFYFNYKRLTTKVVEFDSLAALDLFSLYGEEYSTQYIASDPANKKLNLALYDFQLPPRVKLTAFDIKPIMETEEIRYGDRMLCRLLDWDNGKLEIVPLHKNEDKEYPKINQTDVLRQHWYEVLEAGLLKSFETMGPCSSIEEQLANVFFDYRDELCTASCGSVEEYLQRAKKVDIEYFGVETRFWRKGEDVPAVGSWNSVEHSITLIPAHVDFRIPDYIVDSYLKDYMYQKKTNLRELVEIIFPKTYIMTPEEKDCFLLHITNRNAILLKKYNWFADFVSGAIRHRALKLYSKLSSLVYDIDSTGRNLEKFPQQELVILSQLFGHLSRILESVENETSYVINDSDEIMLSLEGMEYNYEDIKDELVSAVAELYKNDFTVIK